MELCLSQGRSDQTRDEIVSKRKYISFLKPAVFGLSSFLFCTFSRHKISRVTFLEKKDGALSQAQFWHSLCYLIYVTHDPSVVCCAVSSTLHHLLTSSSLGSCEIANISRVRDDPGRCTSSSCRS